MGVNSCPHLGGLAKRAFKGIVTTHLGNLVKLAKQLIEHDDQLLGRAVAGQAGEAHDVSIEDAGRQGTRSLRQAQHPPPPRSL